jgi:hypothetical protein
LIINIIIGILVIAYIAGTIYLIFGKKKIEVRVKLKALEETRSFYKWELKKEGLTEKKRNKFLKALKFIEKIIKKREAQ